MVHNIRKYLLETIQIETDTIHLLPQAIDEEVCSIVEKLYYINGKIIFTGIGKSAIIAQKIVATLNSTGSLATFLHAADAIHGDLGIVKTDDIVVCISKSGETEEIKVLVPIIKSMNVAVIGMVSNKESYLAKNANHVIFLPVEKEADPNNLAPTSSTVSQLVMGDAIAIALLRMRGFTANDFANVHPGGNLGKILYTRVSDLCYKNEKPNVSLEDDLTKVIYAISSGRLGATAVLDNKQIKGIITDGDLRRMLMNQNIDLKQIVAKDIMTKTPKTINIDAMAVEALEVMRTLSITQLLVLDTDDYAGFIHLHDLIKEGIV